MKLTKLGVIGFGYWGPNVVRNLTEIRSSHVVAIADLREDRLSHIRNTYPGIVTSSDYRDLFSMGLDGVVVATPPATHYKLARECLDHGLNVLVEKPLTLDSRHAQELITMADARGLVLMVGHTFKYNPAVRALKAMIGNGGLGRVYYLDSARLNLGLFQRGLNVIWDLAPHDVSILLYLLGTFPVSISAQGTACVFDGVYDVVHLNMAFPDDVMAHLHLSWLDPRKVRRLTLVCSKKMVVYDDVESLEKIRVYDKGVEVPPRTNSFGDFQCSYRYGDIVVPYLNFEEPLRLECCHFIECIENHARPLTDGWDGLKVVRILEAAERSLQNGGRQESLELPAPEEAQARVPYLNLRTDLVHLTGSAESL